MKTRTLPALAIAIMLLLSVCSCTSCAQSKEPTYFGLSYNDPDLVNKVHKALQKGELKFDGKRLTEYVEYGMTDYELSGGKVCVALIAEGTGSEKLQYLNTTSNYLDDILTRGADSKPESLVQKEWSFDEDENANYFDVITTYDHTPYRVILVERLYSPTQSAHDVYKVIIRAGIGKKED